MYQRLEGGVGRAVYFRAPRVRPDWLARHESLVVRFGSTVGRLRDFGLGGMLFEIGEQLPAPALQTQAAVEIILRGRVIYSATGCVVRNDQTNGRVRVALRLVSGLLEPRVLRRRIQDALFRDEVGAGVSTYDAVPAQYRVAVSEAVFTLNHWKQLLDLRERQIRETEESADIAIELGELERVAEDGLRGDWCRVRQGAIVASDEIESSSGAFLAAKRFTEAVLTPLLMSGPIWEHAFRKPRGYPGDFELMNLMYQSERRGDSIFGRILHELGREERLAATVRDRRRYLARQLLEEASRARSLGQTEIRIANLGAGPAREIRDLLDTWQSGPRLVITLIDQDQDALEHANRHLRRAAERLGQGVEIRCRFVSFRELVRNRELLLELSGQDLIYSAGFFDYLPDPVASQLASFLFAQLRQRGRLLIGNALAAHDVKWVPEYVLDWRMIYRTPDDMRRLCKELEIPHSLEVKFDGSGAWQFLEVCRARD